MKKLIEFFLKRSLLVNIIAVIIMLSGLFFMLNIRRVMMPEVRFDMVSIVTVYPGASPLEIERNVTRPIEEVLKGISGIDEMISSSRNSSSNIFVQLETDLDDPESTINDIRQAVDTVTDLPSLVDKPIVFRIGSSNVFPALSVNLSSPGKSAEEIVDVADELEQRILKLPGVSHVNFSGYNEHEIKVDIDPQKLKEFHLSTREIVNVIRNHVISYPAGNIDEGDTQVMVSLNSGITSAEEVAELAIRANYEGFTIPLKAVAQVYEGNVDSPVIVRTDGENSINLQVMKMKSGDNITLSQRVKDLCEEFVKEKQIEGVAIQTQIVDDMADYIKSRLSVVKNNAVIGLILVVVSLFLFLNWRVALFTAAGLPVAFGITFIIMGYGGITINMISMVGMIIVLGMLVDDAIIVAENIYRHMEHGMDRLQAVIQGTSEVVAPVTGTVLTTIAAFTPLFLITGMMGKFMIHMPIIVIIALAASLLEAIIILPVHAYDFATVSEEDKDAASGVGTNRFTRFRNLYHKLLKLCVNNKYKTAGAALLVLMSLFVYFKLVQIPKFEMMPSEGIEVFFVKYELPEGTRKEKTLESVKKLESVIESELDETELKNYITRIGNDMTHSWVFNEGEEYGIAIVYLTDYSDRERNVEQIIKALEGRFETLKEEKWFKTIAFEKVKPGPPQEPPLSVRILSDDLDQASRFSAEMITFLKTVPGVLHVESTAGRIVEEIEIRVDSEEARKAGLSAIEVGEFLRSAFEGIEAASIKKGDKEIEIRVRLKEGWAENREAISGIRVENRMGNLIPLGNIAEIIPQNVTQAIFHTGGDRYVQVTGEINPEIIRPKQLAEEIQKRYSSYRKTYPQCYMEIGGEVEDSSEFLLESGKSLILALGLIFIILASIFNSPFHPFLVLASVPFAFGGVIFAFMLHGKGFTMLAIIGVIGMTGVVVNDAIVLVSYIKNLRLQGKSKIDSIIEGGVTRLRPVILTSLTTLLGLAPTAYRIGGKDPFLPVIALAIGWGLLFSTAVTLLLIPCFYSIGDDLYTLIWRWRKRRN